jgi:hypothetical protein
MWDDPPALDKKIELTWRDIARLGLGMAAEAAVLALIFDSALAVKIATAVIALLGLGVLQFEAKIKAIRGRLFLESVGALAGIYLCFVGYAIAHAIKMQGNEGQLRVIYQKGNELIDRKLPVDPQSPQNSQNYEQTAVSQLEDDATEWQKNTEKWLSENIGPAAGVKFSDKSNSTFLCWGPGTACDQRVSYVKSRLSIDERNLSAIMEQIGVYSQ